MIRLYRKVAVLSVSLLCAITPTAFSAPITTDLDINGTVMFDDDPAFGSFPVSGAATQTAQLLSLLGGTLTNSSVDNLAVVGDNPRSGMLTETGDGVGVDANVSGNAGSAADGFYFDFAFALSNLSAVSTYQIFFEILYANEVNADGSDAFIDAEMNLFDSSNNELWFSDLTSDTVFGDEQNGTGLSSSGATLNDSGLFGFSFTLAPGASDTFTGELTIDGAEFGNDGLFTAQSSAFISVSRVVQVSSPPPPNPVPAPATLFVLSLGLFMLLVFRCRP